jgi:hypothetical protein
VSGVDVHAIVVGTEQYMSIVVARIALTRSRHVNGAFAGSRFHPQQDGGSCAFCPSPKTTILAVQHSTSAAQVPSLPQQVVQRAETENEGLCRGPYM